MTTTTTPESQPQPPQDAASSPKTRWTLFAIVSIVSLVADQITKIWARSSLPTYPENCTIPDDMPARCWGVPVEVIDSFWHWRLSMNPGSAFGLFSSQGFARVMLSIVGIAAVIGMIYMLKKSRADQRVLHWALALVAGGAVGNLIDRIYYGVVTDFILWHVGDYRPGPPAHPGTGHWDKEWPVFNIADVVLVVGVGLMFIDIYKEGKREKALKLKPTRAERADKARKAGLVKDL